MWCPVRGFAFGDAPKTVLVFTRCNGDWKTQTSIASMGWKAVTCFQIREWYVSYITPLVTLPIVNSIYGSLSWQCQHGCILCSKVILLDLSFQIDLKYLTTFPQIGTRVLVNISIEVFKDTKSCINPPLEPTRHVPMGAAPIERGRWDHQKAY